jgi:predicted O-methyltransferase YrrM
MFLRQKTLKLRHAIAKMVAPKLYADMVEMANLIAIVPRPMTVYLKQHHNGGELVGAEIGTARGDNALSILQELPIRKLFLIDPYVPYMEHGRRLSYQETARIAKDKLGSFGQTVFIRKPSDDAVEDITEALDFVYIDGNHNYECVKRDIANYYPLVKKGGVIGGHDYLHREVLEVCEAVDDFVQQHPNMEFHNFFPDWWVIK